MDGLAPPGAAAVLEFRGVSFGYPARRGLRGRGVRGRHVLHGVSLALPPGGVTGLAGVNGAGKTTLLELAAGGLAPSSGEILLSGRPARDVEARAGLGYCPDVPALPPFLTSGEALRLCAGLRGLPRRRGRAACDDLAGRLGLADVLDRRIAELSRGNLVRVGIAQALLGRPDVVLLDESFAPLDPVAQRGLRGVIREEAERGAAVLVSSHQLAQLEKVADRVFVLRDGELAGPFGRRRMGSGALESLLAGRGPPDPAGESRRGSGDPSGPS